MCKGFIIFIIVLFLFSVSLYSQNEDTVYYQPAFFPFCVDAMGMGGAFTANSKGYTSLFYNPAGFGMGDSSLTLVLVGPWSYTDPFTLLRLSGMNEGEKEELLSNMITKGGYGNGIHAGIGFVKSGLGIGASFIMDSYLYGEDNILNATGSINMTLGFILGYAHVFDFSNIELSLGGDIRPMARIYVPVSNTLAQNILDSYAQNNRDLFGILAGAPALHGIGLGFDVGIIARFGDFKYGLSIRDIGGTQFDFRESTFDNIIDSLANSGIFPSEETIPNGTYVIPMNVSLGVSYHPDLGDLAKTIDPEIHLDLQDIVNIILNKQSYLLMLHLGIEATVFNTVTIRCGYSEGYFSAGLGLDVLVLDLNLAFFTLERGDSLWNIPNTSSLIELAVRLKL